MRARSLTALAVLKLATAASLAASLGAALAEDSERTINLNVGFSEIVALARAPSTLVIGDPEVADATVASGGKIIITPKHAGATNLIAIDQEGSEILRATLEVGAEDLVKVRFPAGGEKAAPGESVSRTYFCRPGCDLVGEKGPAATPGAAAAGAVAPTGQQ